MSQQLPGVVKIVVKMPREEWVKLQRAKGGSDSDRITRIVEAYNRRLDEVLKEHKAEANQAKAAEERKALPWWKRAVGAKA